VGTDSDKRSLIRVTPVTPVGIESLEILIFFHPQASNRVVGIAESDACKGGRDDVCVYKAEHLLIVRQLCL